MSDKESHSSSDEESEENISDNEAAQPEVNQLETLFPITQYESESMTGKPLRVYTCGEVLTNNISLSLKNGLDGLSALMMFLNRCESTGMAHGISAGEAARLRDCIEKCRQAYNRCLKITDMIEKKLYVS